jgi:hypothetical protein
MHHTMIPLPAETLTYIVYSTDDDSVTQATKRENKETVYTKRVEKRYGEATMADFMFYAV